MTTSVLARRAVASSAPLVLQDPAHPGRQLAVRITKICTIPYRLANR
ncbi:MAG TPA: hypothetical protein VKU77_28795 [Streptosporangiaceae bacterium]|nr:hypothetical protein [Streptosporangiaceae bacterium]